MVMTNTATYPLVDLRFAALFRGRTDAYGSEEGGCIKEPVTNETYSQHLKGVAPIGIYPMFQHEGEWMTVWGCSDIDVDDIHAALSIKESLRAAGVVSYLERSRSKGYHIWVFAMEPVPAWAMRRMLLCAHQVAEYPAREVNPKQETLQPNQFGNYVRLPYWDASDISTDKRRILGDDLEPMPLEEFVGRAVATRTPTHLIMELAALWRPPTAVAPPRLDLSANENLIDALSGLSPLGKVIWRDGPLPQRDRSSTLTKLAYECAKSGLSPSASKVIITDADRRWGKYHLRTNGDLEIDKLVVRVFTK
jgi:hypothetical protein